MGNGGCQCAAKKRRKLLLVGVLQATSWLSSEEALRRRAVIRELCHVEASKATLRFVLPRQDEGRDASLGDSLLLDIPRKGNRTLRKFFLQHAFFRHAVHLNYRFVARADEDSIFNASVIAAELARTRGTHVVYASMVPKWYMWNEDSLADLCWMGTKSPMRFLGYLKDFNRNAVNGTRWRYAGVVPNASSSAIAADQECFTAGSVGPFHYPDGPFTAYSTPLLRELLALPELARDVARIESSEYGEMPHKGNARYRANPMLDLKEDVYFGYLLFRGLGMSNITFVHIKVVDFRRATPHLFPARVLHKVKAAWQADYVRENRVRLLRAGNAAGTRLTLKCDQAYGERMHRMVQRGRDWQLCAFL